MTSPGDSKSPADDTAFREQLNDVDRAAMDMLYEIEAAQEADDGPRFRDAVATLFAQFPGCSPLIRDHCIAGLIVVAERCPPSPDTDRLLELARRYLLPVGRA